MLTPAEQTFLFDLLNTPSPTGFEMPGQRKWASYLRPFADRVEVDAYGTTWATLEGSAERPRRVMLEAHADEIGFIIKQVTAEGWLRLDRIGGSDVATARGRHLDLLGEKGTVRGIIGNTAIHLRRDEKDEKIPKVHELYVDVGVKSAEEVAALGLRVGHPAVYSDAAELFGANRVVGRALDNRLGGYIIAQVIRRLREAESRPAATALAVNAVQEEIGGHGARMVAHRLRPDVCIVLDVTHATESPGIDAAQHGDCKLGGGPAVTHGTSNHPLVIARLLQCAAERGLAIQHESSNRYTGTDTDVIFNVADGIPCALVSLPLRYMHSVVEMADLRDVEQVIVLLTAFVQSLREEDTFHVQL